MNLIVHSTWDDIEASTILTWRPSSLDKSTSYQAHGDRDGTPWGIVGIDVLFVSQKRLRVGACIEKWIQDWLGSTVIVRGGSEDCVHKMWHIAMCSG